MPKEVKFTEEELKKVKEFQKEYFDIQTTFGQVHIARMRLEEQLINFDKLMDESRGKFTKIQEEERKFLDEITKKYGDGNLNPETGVFTSNKS